MNTIIKKIMALGTRQGMQADKAFGYIQSLFKRNKISFKVETYKVDLPLYRACSLMADGVKVPCLPSGFSSGKIKDISNLTSSLASTDDFIDIPHINFNPKSQAISQANFSFAPSIAISKDSLFQICSARKIEGQLVVKKKKQEVRQILVGNIKNPQNIVFSHFDSIGKGAVDNASGTALMIEAILKYPKFLKDTLFVFDGNEELSYDKPIYWGKGYRNFEEKYGKQMAQAKQLIVVDCIGYDTTEVLSVKSGGDIIKLAFPIKNIDTYATKIKLITSDYDKLMNVYHSDLDNGDIIQGKYMKQALRILKNILC